MTEVNRSWTHAQMTWGVLLGTAISMLAGTHGCEGCVEYDRRDEGIPRSHPGVVRRRPGREPIRDWPPLIDSPRGADGADRGP